MTSSSFDVRTCCCLQASHNTDLRASMPGSQNPFADAAGASSELDRPPSSSSRRSSQGKSRCSSSNLAARHQTQPNGGEPQSASSPPQMYTQQSASSELPKPRPRLSFDEGKRVQQSASSADRATASDLVPNRAAQAALAVRVLSGKSVSFTDLNISG